MAKREADADANLHTLADVCSRVVKQRTRHSQGHRTGSSSATTPTAASENGADTHGVKCPHCASFWISTSALDAHIKSRHPEHDETRKTGSGYYKCDKCQAVYNTSRTLLAHKQSRHNGETQGRMCKWCGKSFADWHGVMSHVKGVHEGVKRYGCEECGKRYAKMVDRDAHVRMKHLGMVDFECSACGSRFLRKGNLERHVQRRHGKGCGKGRGKG